ncbi:MAG: FAD-dependent oxidoreductase [Rhodoferax sp.]|uniref:FAD-dependent oxidoreductase n=1 Tax=Rhodoferax sp. TaxID=50421 RepID=UPI002630C88B|nr:FAD-dependent oxidoreductase [Rhodoferax sp.]MDD2879423.1 FAD-dependent oxidoreductase [Rhodoferax sp.]
MKHLVMLGAGHAHLHLLSTLAAQPLAGVQITLVAPYQQPLYVGMLPGFVAGHHTVQDCVIPLERFANNPAVTWLQRHAVNLDAVARTVTLDDGSTHTFDVLSINPGPMLDKQKTEQMMPGAREHALFALPLEPFGALWPKVLELARQKPLRFAVIGGGATGFELACAVAHRLPASSVTLLSGDAAVGTNYPAAVQSMMLQALKARAITVIQERVVGIGAGEVTLASGARLASDVPIIATGAQAPEWLGNSGLALDTQGFVAVDVYQRSVSHPQVFVAGDGDTRVDLNLSLIKNLRAVLAGIEPSPCAPQAKTLNFLACGNQRAIASWGNWSAQGRWVVWLKDWSDRRFIKAYSRG